MIDNKKFSLKLPSLNKALNMSLLLDRNNY